MTSSLDLFIVPVFGSYNLVYILASFPLKGQEDSFVAVRLNLHVEYLEPPWISDYLALFVCMKGQNPVFPLSSL